MSSEPSPRTMASIWSAKTNMGIQRYGNFSLIYLTFFPSPPSSKRTFLPYTEASLQWFNQSSSFKGWIDFRRYLTMVLSATWCGAIRSREKLVSWCLPEEQATFSEKKYWTSFYITMGSTIWRELTSCAPKAISFFSRKHYQLCGLPPTMCIGWEI